MAEESHQPERRLSKRRRLGHKKHGKAKKKLKMIQGSGEKIKIDKRMRKLFRKRARDYNSDDDDESVVETREVNASFLNKKTVVERKSSEGEDAHDAGEEDGENGHDTGEENGDSGDEENEMQPGITKFTEGCRAFRTAFKKIIKASVSDDSLGPVLSGHKKLIAEKLAEEEAEQKVKGNAKKERQLVGEMGHVKPANFLDSHEKFLIGVATKGVVKLFNAVNKAQNAQKGLNPSRSKDVKVMRKEAFFSELGKTSSKFTESSTKNHKSTGSKTDGEGPGWAPLRDNYMLTNSKLKDWDKMQDTTVEDDTGGMQADSSSDDND
ncbi:uncharacterized protein LOC131153513 [Malania oleifera]|uniref:uncharacterized protein LOC131153513 n=1 Tax=Malania oleifera TaxID=397392 RepID=UPI0025AE24AD|nr:uncharacterized protein LOC131153513 [Malania oleifera]